MILDPERILLIGINSSAIPVRTFKFFDTFNVADFQLAAWNAEALGNEALEQTDLSLYNYNHLVIYNRFKELYQAKFAELLQWIKCGHVLVIFPHTLSTNIETMHAREIININRFPPFNLVNLTPISGDLLKAADEFNDELCQFIDILKYNVLLSGEDMVPVFHAIQGRDESEVAGAVFQVGKGVVVFSPLPKFWDHPKLLDYLRALSKFPDMLNQSVDPLPEATIGWGWLISRFAGLLALIIATSALTAFWAPQLEWLLPWSEKQRADENYAVLASRLSQIEKSLASVSFDIGAIKSNDNAFARRVDQLEDALSRLQKPPDGRPSKALAISSKAIPVLSKEKTPPSVMAAASAHLSTEEVAELLERGDTFLQRGDIASARLFYERAANAGNGRAALQLGAIFDPAFLGRGLVRGDIATARLWYQYARDLGEAEADQRLKTLDTK
jgi:hypothetical protein